MRHILRLFTNFKLGVAVPKAGAGLLASSVTLASVLWVSVTLPNMPVLRAFEGENRTSVSISLQSALLGIDDGNGRSMRDARALARSLGLVDTYNLPTPAELRAFTTSPTPTGPVVTQLDPLALNELPPATSTPLVSQQHDVTPPAPPTPPAQAIATPTPAPAAPSKPKSAPPVVTLPAAPRPQPVAPSAPTPSPPVAPTPPPPTDNGPPATPVVPDVTPPDLNAHANVTADAAGPAGATVSYLLPTAVDSVDGAVPVVCAPAPGSSFAFGPTTVSCSAEDAAHNVAQSSFTVTVGDLTGPVIQTPADAEVETTSAAGAYVAYSATATDAVDGTVAVTCTPASASLFPMGHSSVTCTAEDAAHNVSQASFDVHVLDDTTPPTVQPHADLTFEATGPAGATVTYADPAATDIVDGAVSVACAPASGSIFALGLTTVTCTAEDASHNVGQATFGVLVHDTVAPTIQAHADLAAEAAPGGTAVAYSAPSATDTVDGSVGVTCAPLSGSVFALGHTTVSCSAHDAAGNNSSSHFDVDVRDTTAPVLQSHVDVVAEATGQTGATVAYALPTAADAVDGSVPAACAPASGSLFALGHTTVTCTATDAAGNSSTSTFDVNVRDTTAPVLSAHAAVVVEATVANGAVVVYTAPTATDVVDSSVSVTCAPASGTTFALGHTTVTCSAHDASGNQAATQSFDVQVRDTTGPVIQAHANVVAEATGAGGATVAYAVPTAADAVDGTMSVTCAPASGTIFALGHTTVTCSAQDAAHNVSTSTFDVNVRDTTAPAITIPASFTVSASSSSGIVVTFAATATDAVDGTAAVTCAPSSGATFPVGHTTVTCTAHDNAGNTAASRSFDVVVTTAQSVSDATQAGTDLVNALGNLGLSQSVYDGLTGQLYAAGNSLIQDGDAVAAWQQFNAFDASAQAQLTAAQYAQVSPLILNTRAILGW